MQAKSNFQAVLFDWDGCLADTLSIWLSSYRDLCHQRRLYPTDKQITDQFGEWDGCLKLGVTDIEQYREQLDQLTRKRMELLGLYPGVKKTLAQINKSGLPMAIVTSSRADKIRPTLKRHKIDHYFQVIVDMEMVTQRKPDPEPVNKALELLRIAEKDKKKVIMVGDSPKDILASRAAGVTSVLFFPPDHNLIYDKNEILVTQSDFVIDDFNQLEKIVRN